MKLLDISEVSDLISSGRIVKQKRERAVFFNSGVFYKVWVGNWTQSKITEHAFSCGFYNSDNAGSVIALLSDHTGPRGYAQLQGESMEDPKGSKSWDHFIKSIDIEDRKKFIVNLMEKSIEVDGTYSDLAPSNVIKFKEKINLIDLESFRSFDLIFKRQKSEFELFDLDAWWKPHETAKRDVDKYFRSYMSECLSVDINFVIDSREAFKSALEIVRG